MFRLHWRGPSRIATDIKHANAGRLQWVLPKVAKSLGLLYTSPRWLLRRWRKLGLEVSIHVIMSKFSEILGSTTYVYSINLFVCSQYLSVSHTFSHTNTCRGNQILIVFPVASSLLYLGKSVKWDTELFPEHSDTYCSLSGTFYYGM